MTSLRAVPEGKPFLGEAVTDEVEDCEEGFEQPSQRKFSRRAQLALKTAAVAVALAAAVATWLVCARLVGTPSQQGTGVPGNDLSRAVSLSSADTGLPFCGIAVHTEADNGFGKSQLNAAVQAVGRGKLWHYNWKPTSQVQVPGALFVPMVKFPGDASNLPPAGTGSVGKVVLGWNEPDDAGQAGHIHDLRHHPAIFAEAWVEDMTVARSKGYVEFVSPAIAHDTCWLDHFLLECERTAGCKDLVTYIAMHRYRHDCGDYDAEPQYQGFREDLGYVMTFDHIRKKYNQRGFNIKGLIWDEIGCMAGGEMASRQEDKNYETQWIAGTIVKIKNGDEEISKLITESPHKQWVGLNGPDAQPGTSYVPGQCKWLPPEPGATPGLDAIEAIKSVTSMAWFSIHPGQDYLFEGAGFNGLGHEYFSSCNQLGS